MDALLANSKVFTRLVSELPPEWQWEHSPWLHQ